MHKKSIFFGFGLGMVFLSVIFLLAYRLEERFSNNMNFFQLEERASAMGMVWPTDDVAEIVRRALEMGMVFEHDAVDAGENDDDIEDDWIDDWVDRNDWEDDLD